jgi:hypothetical protein
MSVLLYDNHPGNRWTRELDCSHYCHPGLPEVGLNNITRVSRVTDPGYWWSKGQAIVRFCPYITTGWELHWTGNIIVHLAAVTVAACGQDSWTAAATATRGLPKVSEQSCSADRVKMLRQKYLQCCWLCQLRENGMLAVGENSSMSVINLYSRIAYS